MNAPPPIASIAPPEQRTGMMLAHLLGIFTGIVGALIYWLVTRDDNSKPCVQDQAREALNFQINVLLAFLVLGAVSGILLVVVIGILGFMLMPVLWVAVLVVQIIGAVKANDGELYRYPLIYRFVQ